MNNIIIKDDIDYIGPFAFEPFRRLKTITLPDSLKEISSDAEDYEYAYENECIFINYVGKWK